MKKILLVAALFPLMSVASSLKVTDLEQLKSLSGTTVESFKIGTQDICFIRSATVTDRRMEPAPLITRTVKASRYDCDLLSNPTILDTSKEDGYILLSGTGYEKIFVSSKSIEVNTEDKSTIVNTFISTEFAGAGIAYNPNNGHTLELATSIDWIQPYTEQEQSFYSVSTSTSTKSL